MCLAIPGRILQIRENGIALVDFLGVKREANVSLIENAQLDDYVIVHAGFAIQKIDPKEALENIKLWHAMTGEERTQMGY
ncbi:MAG: HypC/HybG/HupF family hydrogenase formation chaperone [Candidatus Heimdallarchaeota archaeon]